MSLGGCFFPGISLVLSRHLLEGQIYNSLNCQGKFQNGGTPEARDKTRPEAKFGDSWEGSSPLLSCLSILYLSATYFKSESRYSQVSKGRHYYLPRLF